MYLVISVMKIIMKVVYFFCKLFPTKENKILFLSRQSNDITLDFKMIKDKLSQSNSNLELVFLCKRLDGGLKDKIIFSTMLLKTMYHLATSKVCVLDSYNPAVSILHHKKTLKVIQIWHSIGKIKKSGYQTLGKESGRNPKIAELLSMHKNYDIIIAGGREFNPFYIQSFNTTEDRLRNVGLPRIDYLIDSEVILKEKVLALYSEFSEKPVILYAPTFRKGYEFSWEDLTKSFDYDNYILIVKVHPNEKVPLGDHLFYTCPEFSAVDLLSVADVLITDYSAIAIEGAVLNKKTYYYIKDYEQYKRENGLNVDMKEVMKGASFEKAGDLIKAIKEDNYPYHELKDYRSRYLPENLGNSTEALTNIILEKIGE